jgi:sugar phosphate isomerase/epimerase
VIASICLCTAPALRAGPFVYHASGDELLRTCRTIARIGYPAVGVLAEPAIPELVQHLREALDQAGLKLSALGTGAGVARGLTLTHIDETIRQSAVEFICQCMDIAVRATRKNPAIIIGSMQGKVPRNVERDKAMSWLRTEIQELSKYGQEINCRVFIEPLNRYETNVFNALHDASTFIDELGVDNVSILADTFHMNIEEADIGKSIRQAGKHIGHVHIADSNRRPAGVAHINFAEISESLSAIGYDGYLEVEAFPWPNPDDAARQSLETMKRSFSLATTQIVR